MTLKNKGEIYDESVSWTTGKYIRFFLMNARINTTATIITKNIYIEKPSTIRPGVILLAPKLCLDREMVIKLPKLLLPQI